MSINRTPPADLVYIAAGEPENGSPTGAAVSSMSCCKGSVTVQFLSVIYSSGSGCCHWLTHLHRVRAQTPDTGGSRTHRSKLVLYQHEATMHACATRDCHAVELHRQYCRGMYWSPHAAAQTGQQRQVTHEKTPRSCDTIDSLHHTVAQDLSAFHPHLCSQSVTACHNGADPQWCRLMPAHRPHSPAMP